MTAAHADTTAVQSRKFAALMDHVLRDNAFHQSKFRAARFDAGRPPRLTDLAQLPVTLKSELVDDQERSSPFGTNLTFPLVAYERLHETSGTTGNPLRWLDTAESWQWWLDCWRDIYTAAGVTTADRVFLAFGFGPFIGFWSAFEGAQKLGAMVISGGSLSTEKRVQAILETQATVLVCTPTYALRLAEVLDADTRTLMAPDADGLYRGEMVLTNLGRIGSPLIRYCTGDYVELSRERCSCGRDSAILRGGVLGRVDQMLVIRGINVYPSALGNRIRSFGQVEEFEVEIQRERNMAELLIRIEVNAGNAEEIARALCDHIHRQLSLRPRVETAQNLPRYELKAHRFKF